MSTDLIVIATLGGNDLQFLVTHEEKRKKIAPKNTGEVHRALRDAGDGRYDWWLPDAPDAELLEVKGGACSFDPKNGFRPDRPEVALVDSPRLLLVPGILWRDLLRLREELRQGEVVLRRLILVHTDRDPKNPWARNEPCAAAPLLAKWASGWPGVAADTVEVVPALQGMEEMQVRNAEGEIFLLPAAAERIDRSFREAALRFPDCPARLHDAGGMPAVVEAVRASSRLHFRVEPKTPSESDWAKVPIVKGLRHSAVVTLDARRRACELVRNGQFLAAAGIAEDFRTDGPAGEWDRVLGAVALYIQGYMTRARRDVADLTGRSRQLLEALLDPNQLRSLHVALRAEAALRADDFLSAAGLTGTFFDVALFDAVDHTLRLKPNTSCVDWDERQILTAEWRVPEAELRRLGRAVYAARPSWVKAFTTAGTGSDLERWINNAQLMALVAWQELLLISTVRETGGNTALADQLYALCEALEMRSGTGNRPASFRNMVIHSLPSQQAIAGGCQLFVSRRLWQRSAGSPSAFLRNTHAADVLDAMGAHDPLALYGDLVQAVTTDITQCPLA